MEQIIQIKHNRVKNSNWPEANQLAIFKRGHDQGFELGNTMNKSSKQSGQDLNSRSPNCKSTGTLTTWPCCVLLLFKPLLDYQI